MKDLFEGYLNFKIDWSFVFKNLAIGLGFYLWYFLVKSLTNFIVKSYKTERENRSRHSKNHLFLISFFGDLFYQTVFALICSVSLLKTNYLNLLIPLLIISFSQSIYKFFFVLNKVSQNVTYYLMLSAITTSIGTFLLMALFYLLKWEVNFLYIFFPILLLVIILTRKKLKET